MKKGIILISLLLGACSNQSGQTNKPTYVAPPKKIHYYDLSKQQPIEGGWIRYSIEELNYPPKALAAKLTGCVKVEYTIETDGSVSNPVVVKSHPGKIFDHSAIKNVLSKKFIAANKEVKPQSVKQTEIVSYLLLGTPQDAESSRQCKE